MILCMVVLGGMGHIPGVILGAVLLTVFPEALRYLGPLQQQLFNGMLIDPSDLRMLLFGLAMILVMLFRPAGLLPAPHRRDELTPEIPTIIEQEQEDLYDVQHERAKV
jgi:branched-chain amino acid transport system permease protein